jgi:carbamate kinase
MRVVLGVGPDALLSGGSDRADQRRHVRAAARPLARMVRLHEAVVCFNTTGRSTDDGDAADGARADADPLSGLPPDARAAAEQGIVGYWLAQELSNAGVTRPIAVVLTQIVVDDEGEPERVVELPTILRLADRGVLVVCAATGVPVQETAAG